MAIPVSAVKGIILNDKNQFLILQRNPETREKANWDLPGGLVESGEEETTALMREIKEETGLDVEIILKAGDWQFFRPTDGKLVKVRNYLAKFLNGSIRLSEEHVSYKWVSLDEIKNYPVKDESLYASLEKML